MKVYYNGTLVGTKSVSRTPLTEGGYITLGQDASSPETSEIFGGHLMKLSMFGKELTGTEVAELYNEGRCSETVGKKHQEIIFVSWESILSQSRTGNVSEVDSGCPAPEEPTEPVTEEPTEEDCECPVTAHKMWDILLGDRFFNQTLTTEKLNELKAAWNMLDHFVGVRMTAGIVEHLNMFHPSTKRETDCDGHEAVTEQPTEEVTEKPTEEDCDCPVIAHKMWDILLGDRFFNQTLTSEKLNELKDTWDILDRFVGVRMTTGIVEHLNMFHPSTKTETDCDTD